MLSKKFENAIVKMCEYIDQNLVKTYYFEGYFLKNMVHNYVYESYNCVKNEYGTIMSNSEHCGFQNYMQNMGYHITESYELNLEKRCIVNLTKYH